MKGQKSLSGRFIGKTNLFLLQKSNAITHTQAPSPSSHGLSNPGYCY